MNHWICTLGARSFLSTALSIGLSLAVSISSVNAQDSLTVEQLAKGRAELVSRLKGRPRPELEERKYVMPGDNIENATLGEPYAFYRLETDKVRSLGDYNLFKECLTFIMWDIPVSFGGDARMLLGMSKLDGGWHLAHYGKDPTMIERARSRWPRSEGYKLSYVIDIDGPDFIMIEKGSSIWLCPFMERDEDILNVTKDSSGHYPLLAIPYVVKKLQALPETHFDPKVE